MRFKSPIGELIAQSFREPDVLDDRHLRDRLLRLVSNLKASILENNVVGAGQALHDELFEFRIYFLNFLARHPGILEFIEQKITEVVAEKHYYDGNIKLLSRAVSDSLVVYLNVYSDVSDIISESLSNMPEIDQAEVINFESYKQALYLSPYTIDQSNIIKWTEASLEFDYTLIVAELLFDKEIQLQEEDVSALTGMMIHSICTFAAYSSISGFWKKTNTYGLPFKSEIELFEQQIKQGKATNFDKATIRNRPSAHQLEGLLDIEDVESMEKIIQQGCEQIDKDGWE